MIEWTLEPFGRLPRFRVHVAEGWRRWAVGVTGSSIGPGAGLLLPGCRVVHTVFAGAPVDVVFLSRTGRIVDVRAGLKPRRMARAEGPARHALVLPAGLRTRTGLCIGDRLGPPSQVQWQWQSSVQASVL